MGRYIYINICGKYRKHICTVERKLHRATPQILPSLTANGCYPDFCNNYVLVFLYRFYHPASFDNIVQLYYFELYRNRITQNILFGDSCISLTIIDATIWVCVVLVYKHVKSDIFGFLAAFLCLLQTCPTCFACLLFSFYPSFGLIFFNHVIYYFHFLWLPLKLQHAHLSKSKLSQHFYSPTNILLIYADY